MALFESSNRRIRRQNALSKKLLFLFLLILMVQAVKLQSATVKPFRAIIRNPRVRTNHFELLMLEHDRAYSVCEFKRKYVCDNEM